MTDFFSFQLFAGTSEGGKAAPGSWMKHASGVSWLMQKRGPEVYRQCFWDKEMLLSFRTLIVRDPCP
jgi:hypothetical protein